MKKTFKRTVSMAMAAVMSVTMAGILPAAEEVTEDVVEYSTIEEYVEYAIPHYIRAQAVEIDGTFYYSNFIDIFDINDIDSGSIGDCVFLFDDDEIIGKMQVWQVDGEYASVFDTYITDEIQSSFDGDYAIAFGYFEDDFYSYDEVVGSTFVDGPAFEECPDYTLPLNESISKAASVDLAAIPAPYAAGASVDITHVSNQQCDFADKHSLCWAASVAMIVNYHNNKSLTAKDVYRAMKTSSEPDPHGTYDVNRRAFEHYNYKYYSNDDAISASEVLGALSSKKPVLIGLMGSDSSGKLIGHDVVICGISIDNSTSTSSNVTYTVYDPNFTKVKSFVHKVNPSEINHSISYIPDNMQIYFAWEYTFY